VLIYYHYASMSTYVLCAQICPDRAMATGLTNLSQENVLRCSHSGEVHRYTKTISSAIHHTVGILPESALGWGVGVHTDGMFLPPGSM
jgi:hypothetical protein